MDISDLLTNGDLRFIFVSGKGGVGKTTCSSAVAAQLSYERRVLLISTDPAHSLSDAFRQKFSGQPTVVEHLPNLHVMEINPENYLHTEITSWAQIAEEAGFNDLVNKVKDFQSWLSSIPGIDEATALSSVIQHIESGDFDIVVFDTAPTGHTLKLLQLPDVLQAGISKLQGWQSQIWSFWNTLKSMGGNSNENNAAAIRQKVEIRLKEYKASIERVGLMMRDSKRTRFLAVCIAEYLSISETQRLLKELSHHKIRSSHVFINQLIDPKAALSADRLSNLKPDLASLDKVLADQLLCAAQLTSARHSIQRKYLKMLKELPEVVSGTQHGPLTVLELPLLPQEVTGSQALLEFSQLMVPHGYRPEGPHKLESRKRVHVDLYHNNPSEVLMVGTKAVVKNLVKQAQYNGLVGLIKEQCNDGRYALKIHVDGKNKTLLLKSDNLSAE